jgi:hypothetical protein
LFRQLSKGRLLAVANDENDFLNDFSRIEPLPGVCDYGPARDHEEKLVDVRSHASALSGGDNHSGNHLPRLRLDFQSSKFKVNGPGRVQAKAAVINKGIKWTSGNEAQ